MVLVVPGEPPAEEGLVAPAAVLDLLDEDGVVAATDGFDEDFDVLLGEGAGVVEDFDVLLAFAAGVVDDLVVDDGALPAEVRQLRS